MEYKNSIDFLIELMQKSDESFENSGLSSVEIATARIEQGNLYKLLIQHDIFENVKADPRVLEKVRAEIIAFATFRLEILLGIKHYEFRKVDRLDLDDEEILILKEFLSKIKNKISHVEENAPKIKPIINTEKTEFKISSIPPQNQIQSTQSYSQAQNLNNTPLNAPETASKKDQITIRNEILKRKNEILKNAEQKGHLEEEAKKEYEELTKIQIQGAIQRPHPNFYRPMPGINEENAISTSRAEILSQNLNKILKI